MNLLTASILKPPFSVSGWLHGGLYNILESGAVQATTGYMKMGQLVVM